MENLVKLIDEGACRGVVRSVDGSLHYFKNGGVIDLYRLVTDHSDAVKGGAIADRVIGRGAALLLVKGCISSVYAITMSTGARKVLQDAGVNVECRNEVDHIVNRAGTGMCPVESATRDTDDPEVAMPLIRDFLVSVGLLK
ncbi:MAG: DUF1893 domain-containing protein [Muribaculaceae bacterium]|nr:DUF1893 domain-containing protein [Muribaculaceae bacterium]